MIINYKGMIQSIRTFENHLDYPVGLFLKGGLKFVSIGLDS